MFLYRLLNISSDGWIDIDEKKNQDCVTEDLLGLGDSINETLITLLNGSYFMSVVQIEIVPSLGRSVVENSQGKYKR